MNSQNSKSSSSKPSSSKLSLLKDKRFRYGTMSTAMMIVAIMIFVLVNLLADEFNRSRDLTAEQLYTLTDQSIRFLDELEMDVTLSYVTRTGAESHMITQLLAEYDVASRRVTTETRDPMINPTFVHQFIEDVADSIPDGSVIVQSAHGFRVIRPQDMQTLGRNQQTGQIERVSFDAEQQITQAIHALTLGDPSVIYHVTGSGEVPLSESFVAFLESENFIVRSIDAVMNEIPETADALFITLPARDWASVKADRIMDYFDTREGRAFMALGLAGERFPELDRVLQAYGVSLGDYIIIEGNAQLTLMGDPTVMIAPLLQHEYITVPLAQQGFMALLMAAPTGLDVLEMRRSGTTVEPLVASSRDSYGRLLTTEADTIMQVPEDLEGPFVLAVAITDRIFIDTARESRMVVVANGGILSSEVNNFFGGSNYAFISSSLNWLQGNPPGIWIPARRPPGGTPVMLTDAQVVTMTGISMGLLPIGLFAAGIFIWFRRRHS